MTMITTTMRCLAFAHILLLGGSATHAQDKLGSYEMEFFNKVFEVQGSEKGTFYVDCATLDASHPMGGFILEGKDIEAFKLAFTQAKDKYVEWSSLATQNAVTELDKDMDIHIPRMETYFQYGKLHISWAKPVFRFKILKDGRHALLATTDEVTASDNQFMTIDGLAFAFVSAAEVDELLRLIDTKSLTEHFAAKKQQGDIFK